MRPRVRSYGESSTRTLSPGRMRMKCLRILPEMWARTWCLFSSCTRNIALGRFSTTVASTSIASSFFDKLVCFLGAGLIQSHSFQGSNGDAEHPGALLGDRHGILEMRRQRSVGGACRPAI